MKTNREVRDSGRHATFGRAVQRIHPGSQGFGAALISRRRGASGFTLLETVIVVGVALVVMAIAMPNFTRTYGMIRLRSYVSDVGGLIQQTRSAAVRQNTAVPLQVSTSVAHCSGCAAYYVDNNNNATLDTREPEVILPPGLVLISDGSQPVTLDSTYMPGCTGTIDVISASHPLYFNARGLPCPYNSTYNSCTNSPGPSTCSVLYFNGQAALAGPIWAAISVSPAGRVQVWNFNGSVWQ
jgi:Tfp pilus assembly protein FimT